VEAIEKDSVSLESILTGVGSILIVLIASQYWIKKRKPVNASPGPSSRDTLDGEFQDFKIAKTASKELYD